VHEHVVPLLEAGPTEVVYLNRHGKRKEGNFNVIVTPFFLEGTMKDRIAASIDDPSIDKRTLFEQGLLSAGLALDAFGTGIEPAIVHRDFNEDNVLMLNNEGYVSDFGIAVNRGEVINNNHVAFGTMTHMAPEQLREFVSLDHTADVYAAATSAYHLLSGVPLF